MNKYFFTLVILFSAFLSRAQNVPNGGFENWTSHGAFSAPDSWNTTDSIAATQGGQHSVLQETGSVHGGTSAMKLQSWVYSSFFTEPGAATNGTLNSLSLQFVGGTPDNVRHDMLTGWYKYSPVSGDTAFVSVLLTRWNGSSRDTVGKGIWVERNSVSTYTQFSMPISYTLTGNPDTVLIVIASAPIGIGTAHAGTLLYIDDLNFVGVNSTNDLSSGLVSVNVFPNPASDLLTIESKWNTPLKGSVSILDLNGRLLLSTPVIDNRQRIDISTLSNGNYFYELRDEKGIKLHSGKFAVSH